MTAQLGIETNSIKTKGETATRYGYYPDRGETFSNPPVSYYDAMFGGETDNSSYAYGERAMVNRLENQLSEYGMLVYAYDDRYVLNLSGRYDASNRFGQDKNKQFQPTWSVGLKWRIAHEPFLDQKWWLNTLDIYGSYGYQGNAVSTVSPYLIVTYTNGLQMFDYANGLTIKSYPYPDLGWEKTKTWNIGIDAILLDGRLNFTFDYFKKRSTVLADRAIPRENGSETGIVSGMVMENNGYDLIVNVIPIRNENFTWQLSVNTSVADNTVAESGKGFTIEQYLNGSVQIEGRPFSTFYSYEFDGLEQEYGAPLFKHLDQESVQKVTDILVESGKHVPDFSGGFNTMFKWRNFSLYALFAVQWGGHERLPGLYSDESLLNSSPPLPQDNASKKLMKRWRKPGDDSQIPSLPGLGRSELIYFPNIIDVGFNNYAENRYDMYNTSDVRVANTDFIRCRQLSLGYEFEGDWMRQTGINYLQLKVSMTNPFMWVSDKKWDGLDPETGNWPTRRVTSLSLQVVF